jgi:hypothetical protein
MRHHFGSWLVRNRLTRGLKCSAARYLARPFAHKDSRRMVIFHHPSRISYSQIYPFLLHQKEIWDRYGVEIRCHPFQDLQAGKIGYLAQADIVLLQPWFTVDPHEVRAACDQIGRHSPQAELSFLDSYAHNDLRLARYLPDTFRFYLKKSLFKAREDYLKVYRGDTNLNQYYSDLYGLPAEPVDFQVPDDVIAKLRLSPNFFTAPHLMETFGAKVPPPQKGRTLDVQTRLGFRGSPWYQGMREASLKAIHSIPDITLSPGGKLSHDDYMAEMRNARLCFSPFGYGELCWRDIEAIQAGAVIIKQDMSHLDTMPGLYEPGVTYLPVKWDFSDLQEVVQTALQDEDLRTRLTQEAYRRVTDYISRSTFVADTGFLFED